MDRREDQRTEKLLHGYFQSARAESAVPDDLWNRVSAGIERRQASPATWTRDLLWHRPVRLAALVVAVSLVALFVMSPWDGGNGVTPATDLLQRAQAAALQSPALDSVYVRILDRHSVYQDQSEPDGTPDNAQLMHQEIWWADSTHWRSETEMEYVREGVTTRPEPGWLRGGITVSDGEKLWTYSDIEPHEDPAPDSHMETHVHVMDASRYGGLDLAEAFVYGGVSASGGFGEDIAQTLGALEECFDAKLDGTEVVAGRETQIIRLHPRGIGEKTSDVLDAGSCMSAVATEPTADGGRVAEQELTLWLDSEYLFILRAEHVVRSHDPEGSPFVSIHRAEVVDLALEPEIPAELLQYTPPPDVPVIGDR